FSRAGFDGIGSAFHDRIELHSVSLNIGFRFGLAAAGNGLLEVESQHTVQYFRPLDSAATVGEIDDGRRVRNLIAYHDDFHIGEIDHRVVTGMAASEAV